MVNADHAICVPQARIGLYLALRSLIQDGQTVVLSPYTIFDVVNMVICAGGRPCFADIDRPSTNIKADEIAKLMDQDVGAVLVTHLHGIPCDIEQIAEICKAHSVPLIEDVAQAFNARVGDRFLGTFGEIGVFSFGMAKNVNSFYGGMVVTNRRDLAQNIRAQLENSPYQSILSLWRRIIFCAIGDLITARPLFQLLGFWLFRFGCLHDVEAINKRWRGEDDPFLRDAIPEPMLRRMTPMQARMIESQLDNVEQDNRARIRLAEIYHTALSDLPGIILPPMRVDGSCLYLSYPIQVPDRHALLRYLMANGRDLTVQHITNTADLECFGEWRRECPEARSTADQVLLLPIYPAYRETEAKDNVRLICEFFGRAPIVAGKSFEGA
jgi:dTDP-4-amino-4,6-dideoxygalactose transaminase